MSWQLLLQQGNWENEKEGRELRALSIIVNTVCASSLSLLLRCLTVWESQDREGGLNGEVSLCVLPSAWASNRLP